MKMCSWESKIVRSFGRWGVDPSCVSNLILKNLDYLSIYYDFITHCIIIQSIFVLYFYFYEKISRRTICTTQISIPQTTSNVVSVIFWKYVVSPIMGEEENYSFRYHPHLQRLCPRLVRCIRPVFLLDCCNRRTRKPHYYGRFALENSCLLPP